MNSQEKINQAWQSKNVWALTKYYFKKDLTPLQIELVKIITFHKELDIWRIVVSATTRWGKSFCVTIGIGLYLIKNRNKMIPFIGPTGDQARILRDYMTDLVISSPILLNDSDLELTGIERIKKEASKTRMTFTKTNNEYRVFSAEGDADRIMGHGVGSGGGIIVKDEAVLIDNHANAKINRMAGDNPDNVLIIELFNPWHRNNFVFDHISDPDWRYIHIGWEDALKDGRITRKFVEEQRKELTDLEFTILYESNFPSKSESAMFDLNKIEQAEKLNKIKKEGKIGILSCDVADKGLDKTVIMNGMKDPIDNPGQYQVFDIFSENQSENRDIAKRIIHLIQTKLKNYFKAYVIIDAIGVGVGVLSIVKGFIIDNKNTLGHIEVIGAHFGENPFDKDRFLNKKAENYFRLADLMSEGKLAIPKCKPLVKELTSIEWGFSGPKSKIIIIDPDKSPDYADALVYFTWFIDKSVKGKFIR